MSAMFWFAFGSAATSMAAFQFYLAMRAIARRREPVIVVAPDDRQIVVTFNMGRGSSVEVVFPLVGVLDREGALSCFLGKAFLRGGARPSVRQ